MSSLLEILQKKSGPAVSSPAATAPASAASHMQTVELHLAVDNRNMEDLPADSDYAPEPVAAAEPIGIQDDPPALALEPAAEYRAATTGMDTPVAEGADATQSLLLGQRRLRVRRNTSLLVGSLVLILLAVTTAISIVLQYSADRGDEQSVLIPPEVLQAEPAQVVASEQPVQPAVRPLRREVTGTQAAVTQPVVAARDPDWYDTPAVEPQQAGTQIRISRGTTANPLFPKLMEAWNALQAADYPRAENLYREVQAAEATNVDALLGLAAIALRTGRSQEAQELYSAVLEADPKNPAAIAALSTLPAGTPADGDAGRESRLKNLLREQPDAATLHFALGLQYVASGRWPEAQQAFFEAVRNDPANADYAYNLAVSLDQLGQGSAAAAYYERALGMAAGGELFDTAAARQRLDSLRAAVQ